MFIPYIRANGPATRQRWLLLTGFALIAAIIAGLQFTSAALLPPDKTYKLVGLAIGLVAASALMWVERRVRGDTHPWREAGEIRSLTGWRGTGPVEAEVKGGVHSNG